MIDVGALRYPVSTRAALVFGAVASTALAVLSYRAGAVPTTFATSGAFLASLDLTLARSLFRVALVGTLVCWFLIGRELRVTDGIRQRVRLLRVATLAWSVPLLFAVPTQSRDLWAYLVQGKVAEQGGDPYRVVAAAVPVYADQVSVRWQHAPAPYGPLWLAISRWVATTTGGHILLGVLVLRLVEVLGLVLLAWAVPTIAASVGARADVATWLAVANPVVVVICLGGGHNDLLMAGLMLAGVAIARSRGATWWVLPAAAVLVTAAGLIKAPAFAVLPFLVPVRLAARDPDRARPAVRTLLRPYVLVVGGAVVTLGVVTLATGLGFGWIGHLGRSNDDPYGWISFVNPVAQLLRLVDGDHHPFGTDSPTVRVVDAVSAGVTFIVLLVCWLRAHRDHPLRRLAAGFVAVLVLAPTLRPWYFSWPIALSAVAERPAQWPAVVIAAASVPLVVCTGPSGNSELLSPLGAAAVVAAFAGAVFVLRRQVRTGREAAQQMSNATG